MDNDQVPAQEAPPNDRDLDRQRELDEMHRYENDGIKIGDVMIRYGDLVPRR